MANNSPTIVAASLSDDQLKTSINNLVAHVDEAMKKMVQSTNNAVGEMEAKLKSLGNIKIDSGGAADGGASKRTKTQNAETSAVEKTIAARDKQIKKNQEVSMSFDQMAAATQKATSGSKMSVIETYDMQIEMFKNRLREVRQDIDIFNAAIGSGKKTQIEWGQQGLKQANAEAEKLMRIITTLENQRGNLANVLAPQGHTIQNYVNSLQKANPELAQLNEQFKRGKALLQQQKTEFEQNAQAQRGSANQQKQTLDEMNAYIRQNIQREQERREAIRQTGLAAQDAFAKIRQNAQIQLAENTDKPIKGIKELADAITNMRRLYFDMSTAEKESPLGLALKRDIENAQKLKFAIDAYNRTLSGMTVIGTKNNANSSLGAYTELTNILKTLSDEYKRLGREERNAAKGNDLADKIQRLSRATQKIQQQMNRPISFAAAMKGDEKTLDDIAYKMQRLRSYRQGIDLTKPNAANEIKQVDEALTKLQKDADKWMSKSQEMIKNNTALGRSWNYMKNRLAFYFTVGASTQFIKNLIDVRSQYEMNERALGILINSAERGTQIFNELSQMALVSPYTLIELSTAAKQLTAYDIAAKDVVDTTRRLADMASAVGIPIERLTYALGQIKAYGYLNSRDARMFANAGIPLVKQLSDYYTQLEGRLVSTADVYDRIKKKTIDYEQVVQVINKMTDEGGKFFDFQAKMADTLKVRLANLTLAWNNMLNDIGSSNQGVLTTGIGLLRDMFLHWKDLESAISKVATAFGIYKAAQLVTLIWTGRITTAMGVQELVGKKLQARFASLTIAQKGFASAATAGWAALAFVVADAWLTISRNMEEIEQLNKSIADGAKESYEAIDKMLHSSEMVSTRLSAAQGKLSDTDAAKAWEMLREQIELSAVSSKELIAQLLKEPDINKRVTESFNLAEKIEEANRKLSDLNDSLDVSQNSILGGLFGEGLAEDIDDYNARIKYTSDVAEWASKKNRGFWENTAMGLRALFNEVKNAFGSDSNEAQDEIKNFAQKAAQTIKDELGEEGIKDKIQVNEAIARVVRGMEQQFPQIRGKGKVLFETIFYDTMANEFKGAVDSQAYYYEKFLEQLKKDHASAFSGVTEDINKETFKWSSAQIDAIQKTADKVKKDLPAASQGAIDEILRQLNSTDFKVRIVAEMATTSLDNVQKQFREKFIEKPWIADSKEREKAENEANQRYGTLMRKNTESNAEYEKRISDERKKQLELSQKNADIITKNKGKQEEFSKAVLADAQKQKEAADDWLKAAKDIEDKGGYDFSTKGEKSAARKAAKQAESELAKALKDELSTIEKVRSIYKDLTKEGMSHANAVERATRGWDETVDAINRVLQKNGLQKLDLSKFAGIENPRELVNMLQSQLNTLLKSGAKPAEIKELQTKVNTLEVDADKYDLTKITKGLNNELGKLKDEYELAVELDADPELGNAFANMMGIDIESLPHTVKEYADRYSTYLNKYLKGKNSSLQFTGDELRGLTRDDITAFREQVDAGSFNQEWFDAIKKAYDDIQGKRKKDIEDTEKWKNSLIEKYGNLQDKLTKIYKDSVQQQVNAVKSFGTEDQKSEIVRLQLRLEATDDPAELANINLQIAEIVKDVTDKNPIALKVVTSSKNQEEIDTSKAYWDDFKNSELYAMTFEDMANNSTRAIQLIMDKLDGLKDKVKEDPASMKALIKSLEDAQKELNARDPFGGVARSLRDMAKASHETKIAQEALWRAEVDVEQAQQEVDNAEDGTPEEQAAAQQKLADAVKRRAAAQVKLTQAENKGKKAQENLKNSLQGITNQLGNVKELFGVVSKLFRAGGDDETADAIDAISEGFSIMTTVIMGVVAAMVILQSTVPWLLAIAAALSVVVGLVSFLSGNSNKKITEQVEESERAVKRLELAYIDLEHAVNKAYGMATIGANMAAKANKELQLVELKRQLALERSRDSKHRDEDKIIDLQKQIKELEYDIADTVDSIVNDLLGISSVGDAMENMMDAFIEALRSGEDAMATFDESVDEMIANMVKKMFTTKILQPWFEEQWNKIQEQINQRAGNIPEELAKVQSKVSQAKMADLDNNDSLVEALYALGMSDDQIDRLNWLNEFGQHDWGVGRNERLRAAYEKALKEAEQKEAEIQKELTTATMPTTDDIRQYAELLRSGQPIMEENMQEVANFLRELGLMKDDASKNLSALQQGLQGVSEETASAVEAYLNGMSQQAYLRNDLLTQIRDTVMSFDMDVQLGVFSQMLLQLQNNYIVMQSMQSMMENWTVPSGSGIRVELMS